MMPLGIESQLCALMAGSTIYVSPITGLVRVTFPLVRSVCSCQSMGGVGAVLEVCRYVFLALSLSFSELARCWMYNGRFLYLCVRFNCEMNRDFEILHMYTFADFIVFFIQEACAI